MKIDQPNVANTGANAASGISLTSAASSGFKAQAAAAGSDQAELSGVSQGIQTYRDNRAARISQLTALVRSGKYEVDPSLVSSGIVREALGASQQGAVAG